MKSYPSLKPYRIIDREDEVLVPLAPVLDDGDVDGCGAGYQA